LGAFFSGEFRERCNAYEKAVNEGSTAPFKPFSTKKQCKTISYSFGVDVGNNLYRANHPILINWVCSGLEDAWTENLVMDKEQVLYYLSHYFMTVVPARNNARSKAWLEAKRSEEGVKSTESGLLYKVVKAGDMSKAAKSDGDVVKVHYVGRLQNGTVFDASRFESRSEEHKALIRKHQPEKFDKNGKLIGEDSPIEFPLGRVILGWTEGMKLIGPGGKIILYIPAELAYDNRGAGRLVGPNEALEFEVELLEVMPDPTN
jgi:FKBP-type peptidyl-prolyl cis-trans isomerase FkpA